MREIYIVELIFFILHLLVTSFSLLLFSPHFFLHLTFSFVLLFSSSISVLPCLFFLLPSSRFFFLLSSFPLIYCSTFFPLSSCLLLYFLVHTYHCSSFYLHFLLVCLLVSYHGFHFSYIVSFFFILPHYYFFLLFSVTIFFTSYFSFLFRISY